MGVERADTNAGGRGPQRVPLTRREREILGLLAEGMSGVQIASKLVLSPETVRTHVRNAMAKLGASTRSQAVALALQQQEISREAEDYDPATPVPESRPARSSAPTPTPTAGLEQMLAGLVSLYDVDHGAVYVADEDGLSLHREAVSGGTGREADLPESVALGEGALGRAALDRRTQLVQDPGGGVSSGGLIAAPIIGGGRLLGVIALAARGSRPVGRNEMLLLQAFAGRVGDVLTGGDEVERRLERAMERFRASWSASTRVA
jgi:DNA-binding CsgD family transcriptional regulator